MDSSQSSEVRTDEWSAAAPPHNLCLLCIYSAQHHTTETVLPKTALYCSNLYKNFFIHSFSIAIITVTVQQCNWIQMKAWTRVISSEFRLTRKDTLPQAVGFSHRCLPQSESAVLRAARVQLPVRTEANTMHRTKVPLVGFCRHMSSSTISFRLVYENIKE